MTQTTHTPGPWIYEPQGPSCATIWAGDDCIFDAIDAAGNEANARLIAAAPDLLATLEYVLLAADYDGALTMGTAALSPAIRDRIVRSIAKATGEETEA